jgi:hypothetical protein
MFNPNIYGKQNSVDTHISQNNEQNDFNSYIDNALTPPSNNNSFVSAGIYIPPHLRNNHSQAFSAPASAETYVSPTASTTKYIPPHLRHTSTATHSADHTVNMPHTNKKKKKSSKQPKPQKNKASSDKDSNKNSAEKIEEAYGEGPYGNYYVGISVTSTSKDVIEWVDRHEGARISENDFAAGTYTRPITYRFNPKLTSTPEQEKIDKKIRLLQLNQKIAAEVELTKKERKERNRLAQELGIK